MESEINETKEEGTINLVTATKKANTTQISRNICYLEYLLFSRKVLQIAKKLEEEGKIVLSSGGEVF